MPPGSEGQMKLVKRVHYSLVTSGGQKYEEQLKSTSKNEVLCYDGHSMRRVCASAVELCTCEKIMFIC